MDTNGTRLFVLAADMLNSYQMSKSIVIMSHQFTGGHEEFVTKALERGKLVTLNTEPAAPRRA